MQKTASAADDIGYHEGSNLEFGNELVGSGLTGFGLGAGAVALYHLIDRMKREKQKKYVAPPELTAISAGAPLQLMGDAAEQKNAATANNVAVGSLLGALGGGVYGGINAEPLDQDESLLSARLRGVLRGAAGGGLAGAGVGAAYDPLVAGLGGGIPDTLVPRLPSFGFGGSNALSPNPEHQAWRTVLNLGALGGGVLGGRKLVNHFADKKKNEENADLVESARREYFAALSGADEKAAAALDAGFDRFEKQAAPGDPATQSTLDWLRSSIETPMILAALGGAGIGGTYMYNRTKRLSDAENLRRAIESRARTRGNPAMWIDPEELIAAKNLAAPAPEKKKRLPSPATYG